MQLLQSDYPPVKRLTLDLARHKCRVRKGQITRLKFLGKAEHFGNHSRKNDQKFRCLPKASQRLLWCFHFKVKDGLSTSVEVARNQ
jgi:hypothetical protein